jgi:hypothetical protein
VGTTTAAVADEEWATIERRLDGSPADVAVVRRHIRRRIGLLLIPFALAAGIVGVLVGLAIGGRPVDGGVSPISDGTDGTVRVVVSFAGFVAAVAIWVTGAVRTHRRQGFPWSWKEPTVGLGRAERRAIEGTLRGRAEPDRERIPVLSRLAALRIHQSGWIRWLFAGWIPLSIGQAANAGESSLGVVHLALAVFWAVMLAVLTMQQRRWRTFIVEHAGGDPAPGT